MSKSLKKLIDINRLREFKNKLVGAGSAYVQTAAVDQTVAGTKTFSKPIVGSVTGNAATATKATQDAAGNTITTTYATKAHTHTKSQITDFPALATVATSGSYTDLANKPAIPTVNNATLTIQKNGTTVKTFTANASANVTANITVPTKVSELTNDSGFLTSHQSLSNYVTLNGAQTISGAKTFTGDIIGINKERSTEDANSLYSTTAGSKLTYYTISNTGTTLTNVPATVNTTLESRTIRRLSDSDWIVEQICHNSNGLYYRKGSNGTWGAWKTFAFTDSNISGNAATATTAATAQACTGNSATATKLATARTIALSGAATGTATGFDGTANIAIPVTSLDASKLTGTASVSTTGNAATATTATTAKSCTGNAATATKATQDSAGQQIDTTYIKGLAVSGRTITYTKGDGTTGTITTQDTNTDTKVTQTVTTTNTEYPVLFSADANKTATSTTTVRFSSNIKINPSTNTITATTFKGNLTGNVTGNASTATTAATATNATYANWLRTSSHSDHLFHTEWDNAGYFWTYVTAGNGDYRAVRVARSDSAVQDAAGNTITTTYATKAENNTKANDSDVVHKSGNETIVGTKTFNDNVHANGFHSTTPNGFMAQYGGYTLLLRNDGSNTYLLMSDKGGVPGTWSSARPFVISNSTGVCDINGNAATASRSTNNGGFYINNYLVTIG